MKKQIDFYLTETSPEGAAVREFVIIAYNELGEEVSRSAATYSLATARQRLASIANLGHSTFESIW